jgi:cohesin loading factor subunit SCC2
LLANNILGLKGFPGTNILAYLAHSHVKKMKKRLITLRQGVRHAAIRVISLILAQGLVHPVQIVPYLICVATDPEQKLAHTADRELQVII